jgi:hypothetical protein
METMDNEPVAWIDKNTGKPRMEGFIQTDHDIPLYTHQYQRPHNSVLVPCDKLAEMQAKLALLKAHPIKELTDEEIHQAIRRGFARDGFLSDGIFLEIKELLRKASEK